MPLNCVEEFNKISIAGQLKMKLLVKFFSGSLHKEKLAEGQQANVYIKQICDDIYCIPSDMPNMMNNRIGCDNKSQESMQAVWPNYDEYRILFKVITVAWFSYQKEKIV